MATAGELSKIISGDVDPKDYPTQSSYWSQEESSGNRQAFTDFDIDVLDAIMNEPSIPGSRKEAELLASPANITKAQAIELGYDSKLFA